MTGRADNPISETLIGERDEPKINIRWGGEGVMGMEALPKSCVCDEKGVHYREIAMAIVEISQTSFISSCLGFLFLFF